MPGVELSHEAAVGRIAREEIEYLMARGIDEEEATSTIVRGFLNVDIMGLPRELTESIEGTIRENEKDMFYQRILPPVSRFPGTSSRPAVKTHPIRTAPFPMRRVKRPTIADAQAAMAFSSGGRPQENMPGAATHPPIDIFNSSAFWLSGKSIGHRQNPWIRFYQ